MATKTYLLPIVVAVLGVARKSPSAAFLRVVGLLFSLALPSLVFGSEAEFLGHWEGSMVRDDVPLEVSFDFKPSGPHPSGTFTSLSQKAMDYPLEVLSVNGDAIHFDLGDSMVFDGRLSANNIIRTFTAGSAKGDFSLRRTVANPLPYDAVDVSFRDGPVALAGTLCIPRAPGRHPAVVLLQGSGGETR